VKNPAASEGNFEVTMRWRSGADGTPAAPRSRHEEQDLNLGALFAWLQAFAALLRTAQERDGAVVYVAWL